MKSKTSKLLNSVNDTNEINCFNCMNLKLKPFQKTDNDVIINLNSDSVINCTKEKIEKFDNYDNIGYRNGKDNKTLKNMLKNTDRLKAIAISCEYYENDI